MGPELRFYNRLISTTSCLAADTWIAFYSLESTENTEIYSQPHECGVLSNRLGVQGAPRDARATSAADRLVDRPLRCRKAVIDGLETDYASIISHICPHNGVSRALQIGWGMAGRDLGRSRRPASGAA